MKPTEMWLEYCAKCGIPAETPHTEWAFCGGGEMGDILAQLTLEGVKSATASCHPLYERENERVPEAGDFSVVLFDDGEAACVIRNYDVKVVPFNEVNDLHAFLEGEMDRSLEKWREVHWQIFSEECASEGVSFSETTGVVLEKFRVVYPDASDGLLLCEPSEKYAGEISDYRREMLEADSSMDGCGPLRRVENPVEWINGSLSAANPAVEPGEGRVRATQLMLVREGDGRIVGMLQLRHSLPNDYLRDCAGHTGYSVRPTERRKGYASYMLNACREYCRALGIDEIMVSCFEENEGSRRTILKNGGEYIKTVADTRGEGMLQIYHIRV